MVDWIAQALAHYRRASALLDSSALMQMASSVDLAQVACVLVSDDEHMSFSQRIGEAKNNLDFAQAEINQIKMDLDRRIHILEGL